MCRCIGPLARWRWMSRSTCSRSSTEQMYTRQYHRCSCIRRSRRCTHSRKSKRHPHKSHRSRTGMTRTRLRRTDTGHLPSLTRKCTTTARHMPRPCTCRQRRWSRSCTARTGTRRCSCMPYRRCLSHSQDGTHTRTHLPLCGHTQNALGRTPWLLTRCTCPPPQYTALQTTQLHKCTHMHPSCQCMSHHSGMVTKSSRRRRCRSCTHSSHWHKSTSTNTRDQSKWHHSNRGLSHTHRAV